LDWDGLGYMSAMEQNFNPSPSDIKRRTALGKLIHFFHLSSNSSRTFFFI
jgi:hypothetical protein